VRRVVLAIGVALLAVAALWRPVAAPQLVKFPSSVDETNRYRGTFTLHVDPATMQPLAQPMTVPLEIDRRVRTLPGGGAHTAVVEEAVTYRIAGTAQEERHHYVIDRRTMRHVDDARSWSFSPANRTHNAGAYRVTLPLGTDADGRYRIWENEVGRSFWMVRDPARSHVDAHGLSLVGLQEIWKDVPVAPYYRDELRKQGFALERGGQSLEFFRSNDGHALVEPRTGAIVDLVYSDEAISAAPSDGSAPFPVYSLHYEQTPASVADAAALAKDQMRQLDLVERWIPLGVAVLGLTLVLMARPWGLRRAPRTSSARGAGTRTAGGARAAATTGSRAPA
jgi:hypothetical protein